MSFALLGMGAGHAYLARTASLAVLILCHSFGCGVIGPSCLRQQKTGAVTTVIGEVGPGAVVSYQLAYGTDGSQNKADVRWSGESAQGGPRIQVYATRLACVEFKADQASDVGDCAVLARAGWFGGPIASTLIITHGRGNPELLGSPARIQVVDRRRSSATRNVYHQCHLVPRSRLLTASATEVAPYRSAH